MELGGVEEALARGDAGTVLSALLEAWSEMGSDRIADLIEVVDVPGREPLPAGTSNAADAEWHRVAEQGDPLDIPRLLATLCTGTSRQAVARLGRLPRDPRVTTELLRLLQAPPWSSQGSKPFWRGLLDRLGDSGEARVRPVLEGLSESYAARMPTSVGEWLGNQCGRAAERVPSRGDGSLPAELVRVEERLREGLRRLRAGRTDRRDAMAMEQDLLACVYASPADPGPRAVYCDWLLEREDPRGAWMAAQLAGDASAPDSSLRNRVLEGIAGTVTWATFRAGFADAVGLWGTKTAVPRSIGRPEWATVREVQTSWPRGEPAFVARLLELLAHPVMRSLRVLRGPDPDALEALVDRGVRLDAVGIGELGVHADAERLARLLRRVRVAHLDLARCVLVPGALGLDALAGVRSVSVQSGHPVADWLEHLDPTGVEVLIFAPLGIGTEAEWRFTRGEDGRLSVLEVSPVFYGTRPPIRAWPTAPLVSLLGRLAGRLTAFRFTELGPLPGFVRPHGRTRPIEDFEREAVYAAVPAACRESA